MTRFRKIREYIPLRAMIIFAITIVSLILFIVVRCSVAFADFFNYYLTMPVRMVISSITSIIPISIAELLLITIPIWIGLLIFFGVKQVNKGKKQGIRYLCYLLCVLCFVFITFVWTYSSGYNTTSIDKKLGLDREIVSAKELYDTALWLTDNLNELAPSIMYDETGASAMPYSYSKMSSKLCDAYNGFVDKYGILHTFRSKIKPIMLSEPMTYTHISGIYSFMTGESNVNVNYPDFIIASSSVHELAHQRGIAREEEANFIAFLVCIGSNDKFLQYSGYLDVYQEVMSALYSADKKLYKDASSRLCEKAYYDRVSYSKFFEKYKDSKPAQISGSINDSFLQANGQTAGVKSYGMVTDLAVAYYKSLNS
ncbi:MAG: DUF3810 domain-containing protein [Clostridia bacterium]|nr:DUF3810 domain-containing protein [Clostridia bacterium]